MKLLKWILIAVGGVVVLFAGALAFIAATFDPNQYKGQIADLVKEKTQRTLSIEGDIRLTLFPKLGVQLGKTRLSEFRSDQEFAGLDQMRVSLALLPLLSKQVVVDQIQLNGLRVNLVKHRDGRTNLADLLGVEEVPTPAPAVTQPSAAAAPIKFDIDGVKVRKAAVSWKDEAAGTEYTVSDFNLETGRVAPGVPVKFELAAAFTASEPKMEVKFQCAGNVTADLKKQTLSADLTARIDESNVKAKVDMTNFAAPFTRFDIAFDKLDVDRYLSPTEKRAMSVKPASARQAEQPINFSPIKKLSLAGSLRIDHLVASNMKAQNLRMDLKARDGRLEVNLLSADLYQGSTKGTASVNANNNQLAIKQSLSGVSIGPLLRDALNQDLLDGHGNVALDVTATGKTVSAIKKSLNGTVALGLKDGALKGINLAQSLRNAKVMFTGGTRDSEQAAAPGEKTDFSELSASFLIREGVAHNDDLLAKSPFLRLTGAGDINIAEGSLNYLVKAAAVATSTGQGGKDLADTRGLTLPVRASGPFTALKYKLEFGSAFSDSAKQQVEAKKEELKGKLKDQIKSRLQEATKPAGEAAPATGGGSPPPSRPEDKLKEKLKKLF
jgi:AsmA protein